MPFSVSWMFSAFDQWMAGLPGGWAGGQIEFRHRNRSGRSRLSAAQASSAAGALATTPCAAIAADTGHHAGRDNPARGRASAAGPQAPQVVLGICRGCGRSEARSTPKALVPAEALRGRPDPDQAATAAAPPRRPVATATAASSSRRLSASPKKYCRPPSVVTATSQAVSGSRGAASSAQAGLAGIAGKRAQGTQGGGRIAVIRVDCKAGEFAGAGLRRKFPVGRLARLRRRLGRRDELAPPTSANSFFNMLRLASSMVVFRARWPSLMDVQTTARRAAALLRLHSPSLKITKTFV